MTAVMPSKAGLKSQARTSASKYSPSPRSSRAASTLRTRSRAETPRARNSATTFGHFGQSGSFLWVDPDAGLACASLADRPFGEWAAQAWPALSDAVLAEFAR